MGGGEVLEVHRAERQVEPGERGRLGARVALHLLAQVHHDLVVEERRLEERDLLGGLGQGQLDGARARRSLDVATRACPWAFFCSTSASTAAVALIGLPSAAGHDLAGLDARLRGRAAGDGPQHGHAVVEQRVHGDEPAPGAVDGGPLVDLGDEAQVGGGLRRRSRRPAPPPRCPRRAGTRPRCAGALLGEHRDQEALHLEGRRQLLGHLADHVGIDARVRRRAPSASPSPRRARGRRSRGAAR